MILNPRRYTRVEDFVDESVAELISVERINILSALDSNPGDGIAGLLHGFQRLQERANIP